MLCLGRKRGETILIGPDITIHFVRIDVNRVRVGIEAPKHLQVRRGEHVLPVAGDIRTVSEQRREAV